MKPNFKEDSETKVVYQSNTDTNFWINLPTSLTSSLNTKNPFNPPYEAST